MSGLLPDPSHERMPWAQGPGQGIAAARSLVSLGPQEAATNI